jgi:hypothetical protein
MSIIKELKSELYSIRNQLIDSPNNGNDSATFYYNVKRKKTPFTHWKMRGNTKIINETLESFFIKKNIVFYREKSIIIPELNIRGRLDYLFKHKGKFYAVELDSYNRSFTYDKLKAAYKYDCVPVFIKHYNYKKAYKAFKIPDYFEYIELYRFH